MHLSRKKIWFTILTSAIVLVAAILIFPLFTKTVPYSNWMRQAAALQQLGYVLQSYMKFHNNSIPSQMSDLKQWAITQGGYQDKVDVKYWWFIDPESGLAEDWILCPASIKSIRVYAPKTKQAGDASGPRRLTLMSEFYWEFIPEAEFQELIHPKEK